jgi:hypothetical protein
MVVLLVGLASCTNHTPGERRTRHGRADGRAIPDWNPPDTNTSGKSNIRPIGRIRIAQQRGIGATLLGMAASD